MPVPCNYCNEVYMEALDNILHSIKSDKIVIKKTLKGLCERGRSFFVMIMDNASYFIHMYIVSYINMMKSTTNQIIFLP